MICNFPSTRNLIRLDSVSTLRQQSISRLWIIQIYPVLNWSLTMECVITSHRSALKDQSKSCKLSRTVEQNTNMDTPTPGKRKANKNDLLQIDYSAYS